MGVLLNLTKEYFGDIEREEDWIEIEGVNRVSFTDGNGRLHKKGYRPKNRSVLKRLMDVLIGRRGNEGDFNDVNTSLITDMSFLFIDSEFNGDISGWKFPKVIDMSNMFENATAFNQPIGGWKFPKAKFMGSMFRDAAAFDQDISGWNIGKVLSTTEMFKNCPIKDEHKPKKFRE